MAQTLVEHRDRPATALPVLRPDRADQVAIDCRVVEIVTDTPLNMGDLTPRGTCVVDEADANALEQDLPKQGTIRTIAHPHVVSNFGRAVHWRVGHDSKSQTNIASSDGTPVATPRIGTELDVTPTQLGNHRIRLEFRVRHARILDVETKSLDGLRKPIVRSLMVDTTAELEPGQCYLYLSPFARDSAASKGFHCLVMLSATLSANPVESHTAPNGAESSIRGYIEVK